MKRGYDVYQSALIGDIYMVVSEAGVEEVFLLPCHFEVYHKEHPEVKKDEALCRLLKQELAQYFEGSRLSFDLPLIMEGTAFQKKVWEGLKKITYGKTISYKQLAENIGSPKAVRAVGGANRKNKLPLLIPCHRVVGANGRMVGFMGTHTDVKEKLLAHEKAVLEKMENKGERQ